MPVGRTSGPGRTRWPVAIVVGPDDDYNNNITIENVVVVARKPS